MGERYGRIRAGIRRGLILRAFTAFNSEAAPPVLRAGDPKLRLIMHPVWSRGAQAAVPAPQSEWIALSS